MNFHSGVPQESVAGPLRFQRHVNDMTSRLGIPCIIFTNKVSLLGIADCKIIQRDLENVNHWSIR